MDATLLHTELTYKAIRSSGAGGQHVNKVASKVVLSFNLTASNAVTEREKDRLAIFLKNRLSSEGILQLSSSESRSQIKNKKLVTNRFFELIEEGLKVKKYRKKSNPSRSSILKTKLKKKKNSDKKELRKKPKLD